VGASIAASQHHHQQVVSFVKDIHISLSKYLPADSLLTTPESVEHCQDLLEQLEKCDITLEILTDWKSHYQIQTPTTSRPHGQGTREKVENDDSWD
jgi:hypothetical protein